MKPLHALSASEVAPLRGLLFDLDDTLLTHGILRRDAYSALWDLADAKWRLIGVTGRPSGWGEVLARQWPVDAMVTENGAITIAREGGAIRLVDGASEAERRSRRMRLAQLVESVRQVVPTARLTDDVDGRRSDITWDIAERVRLPREDVERIANEIRASGARVRISSVHIHATYDADDKASGSLAYLRTRFAEESTTARFHYAYVGDSLNDAQCFAAFQTTFGVANVHNYADRLPLPPRYVASLPMGEGFVEIARALLALK